MHWTALMAKRFFPAHARVADDLACIGCGYNLRTLMANANCPECGMEVGRSLFVLAKPHIVAEGLRSAGKAFLAASIMALPMFISAYWALIVAMTVVSGAAAWRLIGVGQLFFRGAIVRLPVIGWRLRVWMAAAVVDLLVSLAGLVAAIVIANNINFRNPQGLSVLSSMWLLWMIMMATVPIIAARFGHSMALVLGYNWMIIEFRIHQAVAWVGLLAAFAFAAISLTGVTNIALVLLQWAMVAVMGGSLLVTCVALIHLGNAADETSETWEDLIDSDRVEVLSQPPQRSQPREAPAVQLAPQRSKPVPNPKPTSHGSIIPP